MTAGDLPPLRLVTFLVKVRFSCWRGANLRFLDFLSRLEKSLSVTFLYELSRGVSTAGETSRWNTSRHYVPAGTVADIYTSVTLCIYMHRSK